MSFVKISDTILDSSVWSQPDPILRVWFTMLIMASPDGVVNASISGLARRAIVSLENTQKALEVFLGPDPESRDGTTGERIQVVPGGWLVLNHGEYRERRTEVQIATAERVARHRERKRGETAGNRQQPLPGVTPAPVTTEAEAEAEAEAEQKKKTRPRRAGHAVARPEGVPAALWEDFLKARTAKRAPLSATAWRTIEAEAKVAGWTVEQALTECVARGWAAFKAEWVANARGRKNGASKPIGSPPDHIAGLPFGAAKCPCPACEKFRAKHPGKTSWRMDASEPAGAK